LVTAGLGGNLAAIVPVPGATNAVSDDPTAEGLATEGNESEYGEAWFEGTGDRSLRLYEMAVPFNASMALARGRFDLSTLWASNRADTPANDVFHAWGFTDVHVRYTQPLGTSGVSLTLGGAFPTRDVHGVDDDIRRIPIAPDMLPSAMYRRRSAPAVSGGLYFTRPTGDWTWGAAAGAEWNASFDELAPSLHTIAVAPGMRWRLRGDAVRPLGVGRVALGTSWMGLSPATRGSATIRGGDRILGRASYAVPVGIFDVEMGGWVLRTARVTYNSDLSFPTALRHASTMSAGFVSARSHAGAWTFDTNVELKRWEAGAGKVADLIVPQLNAAHPLRRGFAFDLGADYVSGHFHEAPSSRDIPVRGWMLHAGFRLEP
ncbi:MAG: hypothetical protein H3C62_18050, partial [Gemmatimonadaceae bacterium]|nr:hypothetical protein [Gemmatimonadaceae bacterium]